MYSWKRLSIPRLYGIDQKSNIIDVSDGQSLDCNNVFQNGVGIISKRRGNSVIFGSDTNAKIQEIGACTLSGTKYYFRFSDGNFEYSTSITGTTTILSPSPAVSSNDIWWDVLDDKLFFVDGSNALRYFDGSTIKESSIYSRPTVAPTGSGGTGFDYSYTVDGGLGESPSVTDPLIDDASAATITITGNTGPQTLVAGDKIRVYSRATSTLAQWRNVTPTSGAHANGSYGSDSAGGYLLLSSTAANYSIATTALSDSQPILYTDIGVAPNYSAISGLTGITAHYGRLIGWSGSNVYVSKVTNPHSWPPDSAAKEAFNYGFFQQDGEDITVCKSFQESLYVFKNTKIAAFGGVGPDDTGNNAFSFRRIETNGIGCVAGKSIQVIGDQDGTANYLIWLGREGFYASTGDKPVRIGEKIESNIWGIAKSNQAKSVSFYHKRDGFYHCHVGTDAVKTGWTYDITKDSGERVGWFKSDSINPTCMFWDEDKYIFGNNDGVCASERNSNTSNDFSDIRYEYIDATDIDTSTDIISVSNSYETGDSVIFRTSGTVPTGLTNNTTYYAIRISATEIQLALSQEDALAGTYIDITSQGTGTHSLVGKKAISSYYTTNWIKFKDGALVKKLNKPTIFLNAAATSISLNMQIAIDWYDSFFDPHTIEVTSSDSWGLLAWGDFVWGAGTVSTPKNIAIAVRKVRSIRYKFSNETIDQDFNLKGIEQEFAYIRNRGELS